jgi:PPOX class probable F420-dependent enzyme
MKTIPERWKAILQRPVFVHLTTLMPDGSPQASPVWVDLDGDALLINSAQGRVKDQNIRREPRVAISATDPDDPYKSFSFRGRVTSISTQGADEVIDKLAKKYLGKDKYPFRQAGEVRVTYRIEPDVVKAT